MRIRIQPTYKLLHQANNNLSVSSAPCNVPMPVDTSNLIHSSIRTWRTVLNYQKLRALISILQRGNLRHHGLSATSDKADFACALHLGQQSTIEEAICDPGQRTPHGKTAPGQRKGHFWPLLWGKCVGLFLLFCWPGFLFLFLGGGGWVCGSLVLRMTRNTDAIRLPKGLIMKQLLISEEIILVMCKITVSYWWCVWDLSAMLEAIAFVANARAQHFWLRNNQLNPRRSLASDASRAVRMWSYHKRNLTHVA